jgi:hypothetical protein
LLTELGGRGLELILRCDAVNQTPAFGLVR